MVESRYLSPEHLIRALKAGRFYASSGVELESFRYDPATKEYKIVIQGEQGVKYSTEFIGTMKDADFSSTPALDKDGNIAMPFNTAGMSRGWINPDGTRGTAIFKDE